MDVRAIQQTPLPAYFVPGNPENPDESKFHWAIVDRGKDFVDQFAAPWRRLSRTDILQLRAYDSWGIDDKGEHTARAQIIANPDQIRALSDHTDAKFEHDLVLRVWPRKDEFPMKRLRERGHAETLVRDP